MRRSVSSSATKPSRFGFSTRFRRSAVRIARSAVDAAAPLAAPRDEGVDVDGYLADLLAGRFKVTDRGEGSALPVLERVIERVAIIGELAQTLPALARVPSEAELCIDG